MSESAFARRLGAIARFNSAEQVALAELEGEPEPISRGSVFRVQGDEDARLILLQSGWASSCIRFSDGRRQIVAVHIPGDLMGLGALSHRLSQDNLTALTDLRVSMIRLSHVARLFAEQPRLAAMLLVIAQSGYHTLAEAFRLMGRGSGEQRLAALILSLRTRLRLMTPGMGASIPLPLTQHELGDLLGLTPVHTNRVLQHLSEAGILAHRRGEVTVLDERALLLMASANATEPVSAAWLSD